MADFWTFQGIDESRIALIDPGCGHVTYGALSTAADTWLTRLRSVAGDLVPLVALEFVTTPDAIAAYLGVLRAGLPLLLTEPGKLGIETSLARTWRPDINLAPGPDGVLRLSERSGWREEVGSLPPPHPELCILLSTSGSTGEPKLVRLSQRNISSNADAIAQYLHVSGDDRAATTLPLFYCYGLSVLNSYLAAGASLVITAQSITDDGFWEFARASCVTSLAFVPHQFDLLRAIDFDGAHLPSLRYVTQAGGKLDPETAKHFWRIGKEAGWDLFIMYGQAEASPRISFLPPESLPDAADTIGRAIPGGRLWLSDDEGREIRETDVAGELIYEGPNVMMGYASTRSDLARGQEVAHLRTGDVAERTEQNYFRVVGRMKRFVKLYGLRLSLDQIEASLRAMGIIAHAVGVDDRLVLLCEDSRDQEAARSAVAESYGLPTTRIHVGHLTDVPLLGSGKIDDQALRRIAADVLPRASETTHPGSAISSISDVMRLATRHSEVRPTDTFIGLGGDSLGYLEVQIALDEMLGAAPPGWERMTVAELDALVRLDRETSRAREPTVSVGIDVVMRILAISVVVIQHASNIPLFGGAWVLLAVMGYSAARFQSDLIAKGRSRALIIRMLYPIIPIYYVILLIYATFRDDVPWKYWVLLGNYEPWTGGSLLVVYWFVSVYAQIVAFLALVAAVHPARRRVAADAWYAAALTTALAAGALLALAVIDRAADLPYLPQRGFVECLSVFAIGWMLRFVDGARRVLVTASLTAAVLMTLAWLGMTPQVVALLVLSFTLLAFDVHVRVPSRWARAINRLASLTLYVYLAHQVVIFFLSPVVQPDILMAVLALVLSFVLAAGMKQAFRIIDTATLGRDGRARAGV